MISLTSSCATLHRLSALSPRRWFALAGFVGICATFTSPPALAANGDITVDVTATPAIVSLARSGVQPLAAYDVLIANHTNNVVNQVVFDASAATAAFVLTTSGLCTPSGSTGNAVHCDIGQLRGASDPLGSVAHFTLYFAAPSTGTKIDLNWSGTYSNGNSPNAPPSSFMSFSGKTTTALDPLSKANSEIDTALLPNPATAVDFFTGNQAIATSTDPLTSKLTVPQNLGQSTLRIIETTNKVNTTSFASTNDVEIQLPPAPNTGAFYPTPTTLAVTVHVSQIRSKVTIGSVVLIYRHNDEAGFTPLAACQQPGNVATSSDQVCIQDRQVLADGSFRFLLSMLRNGFLGLR